MNTWFDEETGLLRLDEVAAARPTLQHILADGVVADEEIAAQSKLVSDLLRRTHEALDESSRELVGELLAELAVFQLALHHRRIAATRAAGATGEKGADHGSL
jgi:hypothetical protein